MIHIPDTGIHFGYNWIDIVIIVQP